MRKIRTLHLASFDGNVGDNANHAAFYANLNNHAGLDFDIDQIEIREFYWNQRKFDITFVDLANSYDLLIIGGGNYFELWVKDSPTGTSIAIKPELFKQIKTPVLFNALGVDPGQGASEQACQKLRIFLNELVTDSKNLISIRNDGSKEAIEKYIGIEFMSDIIWTPDAGVTLQPNYDLVLIDSSKNYLAINIAGDMLETRFCIKNSEISAGQFVEQFAKVVVNLVSLRFFEEIVFIPHIYKDLTIINDILEQIPDNIIRRRIVIAPLLHGTGSEQKIFTIYKNATLNIGMRFHAIICSVGMRIPTVALINYRQIEKLVGEMDIEDYAVDVRRNDFGRHIVRLIGEILTDQDSKKSHFTKVSQQAYSDYKEYHSKLSIWFDQQFGRDR